MGHFFAGIALFAEGLGLLRRERALWVLAAVPVLLAMLTLGAAFTAFWLHLDWIHAFWSDLLPTFEVGAWWTWIYVGPARVLAFLAIWLGVLASLGVCLVASLLMAKLLSAPFLDVLSERVEELVTNDRVASGSGLAGVASGMVRSFVAELRRVGFLLSVWIVLTGIGFVVPGAHFVTGPILVATTILFLPLDYAGFALDRREVSFETRRRWLWAHLPLMLGFGAVAFAGSLVPGLNLLVMPSLVTAGTLLVTRQPPGEGRG